MAAIAICVSRSTRHSGEPFIIVAACKMLDLGPTPFGLHHPASSEID
jgi:hypothetical protein